MALSDTIRSGNLCGPDSGLVRAMRKRNISPAVIIRPHSYKSLRRTVIVVGAFRGGTSRIAEMIHQIGVPMTLDPAVQLDGEGYANWEDPEIRDALEVEDWSKFQSAVHGRNASSTVWGWKWPGSIRILDSILPLVENPCVVAVFRDIAATITSEIAYAADDHSAIASYFMEYAISQQQQLVGVLGGCCAPLMLVSHERSVDSPSETEKSIIAFLR